tara:strand:- start:224 stop:394 length:171 start_codon:yes stop_codon:yes gene_type:complete
MNWHKETIFKNHTTRCVNYRENLVRTHLVRDIALGRGDEEDVENDEEGIGDIAPWA